MYFIILNILILAFFLFLIVVGIILRYWSYIPVNAVGILVVGITLYLETFKHLSPGNIILFVLTLIVIFFINMVFVFRDFKEEISKTEVQKRRKYLMEGIEREHFKLIKDEQLIKNEIEKFKKIPVQDRTQAFEMLRQGNDAFIQHNYEQALEKYDLSTNWVETGIGFLNQSGVLLKLGKFDNALILAEKASKASYNFYEALLNQGVALEKLKQVEKALQKYRAAAKICPIEYEIWYCIANVLFKTKKYREAISLYDKSLNLYAKQFDAWYYKGISLEKTGKDVEALRSFEQAIRLKSNHSKVYYLSGNILSRLNRDTEAIAAYEKAIKINAESVATWNNLGITLNKLGRNKDAIKCFDRAIRLKPEFHEAWLNKGLALDTIGKYKKAYLSYKKFIELAPKGMKKRLSITQKRVVEIRNKLKIKTKKNKKSTR